GVEGRHSAHWDADRLTLARSGQRGQELLGKRGGQLELLIRERVPEAQPCAVQELAGQAMAPCLPVARVSRHRMADRREVSADLVRAPGLQAGLDQRVRGQEVDD